MIRFGIASILVLTAACNPPATGAVSPAAGTSEASSQAPDPWASGSFENPGGMWTPAQLTEHAATLKRLGLEIDPAKLTDLMAHPLGAVVWLGGCSASFVSPDGLIITNHHCVTGALQYNSTPKQNLLTDGFLARTRAEEKSNGPAAKVFVTQAFHDVTAKVRAGIDNEADDLRRHETIQSRTKELVAGCEKDRPELRCRVVEYFGGERYVLIEQLELKDIRLVYAPAEGVGNFGGEIDNWRWPRHSGDFGFYRAYVGPDGKPASYHVDNVPFRPKHHLKVASQGLKAGDMVFIAGYPGRTTRLKTAAEVSEAVDWYYPLRQKLCEDYLVLLDRLAKEDKELAIKGRRLRRGLGNVLTNTKGMLDGLVKGGLKAQKVALEAELKRWIALHPEHREGAIAVDRLAAHYAKYRGARVMEAATREAFFMSSMLNAADSIVRMAQERPKTDAERHPSYQKRNWKRMIEGQKHSQRSYARRLDQEKFKLALLRAARLAAKDRPALVSLVVGSAEPTAAAIDTALTAMYRATKLESAAVRVKLLESATVAELAKSKDPFIKLALKMRPELQAIEDRADAYMGATAIDRPKYVQALRAHQGGVLAPDANRTLRISYGTVRGYRPKPSAEVYRPFTGVSGVVKKHRGKVPFNAPAGLLDAARKKAFGPYVHPAIGEVPVDFLADLDITGGNSGSATLNARGELVGLAFDGNYEAMASDWLFMPAITRSIHVDIRYVLWMMDVVDGADHLLREMGIKPQSGPTQAPSKARAAK